ncbi:MAG: copper-translocating P-type ATPase [Firmicutes bacterium HGW-Firmicutes-9]|nr:MAG: copper-translocating P-type ATPase [Firmicutes bacterium HGW-Firmicutes-9]
MEHGHMDHEHHHDHKDMMHGEMNQMDHNQMDHSQMEHSQMEHSQMDHSQMDHSQMDHSQHQQMAAMNHSGQNQTNHETGHSAGHHDHHMMMVKDFKTRFFLSLIVTVPLLILSPMIQMFLKINLRFPGDSYILFALATLLFIYGGKPFFTGARDELKQKSPAMMTLIAFAISVAYIYSSLTVFVLKGNDFFWELATLIVIMLLGHWIEMKSVMGASRALDELAKLMPQEANLISDTGEITAVLAEKLKAGDKLLVKPGEKIPIDGTVFEGISEVNESMVTGESVPVKRTVGDEVIGGAINGDGILKIEVTRTGEDTFLSQVIKLVREAQQSKSRTQRLADKAAKLLFYIALSAGVMTAVVWTLIGKDISFIMERAVTVIVICCPHALGLAIPLVTARSTSIAAQNGLLIRNRVAFENARKIGVVVFDKTGTLTEGAFGVTDVIEAGRSKEEILTIASSLEMNSEHPIAKGIVRESQKLGYQLKPVTDYMNMAGKGLMATIDGSEIMIVSPGYMQSKGKEYDVAVFERLASEGKTVVFVLIDGALAGMIALADIVRPSAKQAVDSLRRMNIESIMLTGDNQKAALHVGKQVGIYRVIAEVLPQQKADKIDEIKTDGRILAMTGDGINDAPSLAKADLGIAIGAGTDVAIETADVILVKSNPNDVVNIIKLSKAIYKKMIQNLVWATGYNALALPLAAGVLYGAGVTLSPAVGAVLMSLSTVIVAINARLLRIK